MRFMLVIPMLILVGCGKPSHHQGRLEGYTNIYIFGDSIAASQVYGSYSYLLGQYTGLEVRNEAVPSSILSSPSQYGKILATVFTNKDIVLLDPGVNDTATYDLSDPYWITYRQNLIEIIQHVQSSGARLILGTTLRGTDPRVNSRNHYTRAVSLELAQVYGVDLLDTQDLFHATPENMVDLVHPNIKGHSELAAMYYNRLVK